MPNEFSLCVCVRNVPNNNNNEYNNNNNKSNNSNLSPFIVLMNAAAY